MKKEIIKKQYRSSGATVQSAPLSHTPTSSFSGTHSQQSPISAVLHPVLSTLGLTFLNARSFSGLTRESSQTNLPYLSLDPRVKPEGDSRNNVLEKYCKSEVKPENDNMGRLGGGNMKRIFSAAVLTLCSALFLSSLANAACSPVDCAALGYSKTEAACEDKKILRCPFDATKVNCVEKALSCSVGDIFYSDNSCNANVITGKTPIGVVGYITDSGRHGKVVALNETNEYWSMPTCNDLQCLQNLDDESAKKDMNGKTNTACILSQPEERAYPAAKYCYNYRAATSGKGSSGWYLPAVGELLKISSYRSILDSTLMRLSQATFIKTGYLTSTEVNNTYARTVNPYTGGVGAVVKCLSVNHMRCMLEF